MNKTIEQAEVLKMLENMPLHYSFKLKVGENEFALKEIRKMPGNKNATMESIQIHNAEANGWGRGYKAAINEIKEWRNEQYLKLKNLV